MNASPVNATQRLGRFADLFVFGLSDSATFITGAVLVADGAMDKS